MGELGTLRLAGRAGGVEDHRRVLVVAVRDLVVRGDGGQHTGEADRVHDDRFRPGLLGAAASLAGERMPGEDQPGPGVAEVVATSRLLSSGFIGTTTPPARSTP